MKKEPVNIKELDPNSRITGFNEVVCGYTEAEAIEEAKRCLQCNNPTCIEGCPVEIDIKKFIYQITQKDHRGAYFTIREKNNFASICGRVCPAEYQCRKACVLNKNKKEFPFASDGTINIHFLERFIGDYGIKNNLDISVSKNKKLSQFKVAIVGSGPAGLCCGGELAREGIEVVLFESLHKTGGVLRYGIPPFRLPADVLDAEINYLKKLGVKIITNCVIGRTKSIDDLFKEGFSAVFLGVGAGVPSFLGIDGETLGNVYSANEFLTRVNLMGAYMFPQFHTPINIGKNVIVIGGGNTAMDAARVSLRLQKMKGLKPNTKILYRRTEVEMPARRPEIEHAKEEGIDFNFLIQPIDFVGDEKGFVKRVRCLKCELGEPDSSGRRRPLPIEGSEFEVECDAAVVAVGLKANQLLTSVTPQIELDKWGDVIVNSQTMETSMKGVFAGGDIVGGEGTVIEAMGMAKKASQAMINYLSRQ